MKKNKITIKINANCKAIISEKPGTKSNKFDKKTNKSLIITKINNN
jgi:hypothetical protein